MTSDAELKDRSYEQLIEAMEELTSRMAGGEIGIEEVADLYERVGRLHAEATTRLASVRQRIEGLMAAGEALRSSDSGEPGAPSDGAASPGR